MRATLTIAACLIAASAAVSACAPKAGVTKGEFAPEYLGIQTVRLDNDLVSFRVAMKGARNNDDVADYGRCAAAQYALIRGAGFARHVRTNVAKRLDGVWLGDAVYTISATLPLGLRNIDAEVGVRDCGEQGIPTV